MTKCRIHFLLKLYGTNLDYTLGEKTSLVNIKELKSYKVCCLTTELKIKLGTFLIIWILNNILLSDTWLVKQQDIRETRKYSKLSNNENMVYQTL